MWETCKSRWYHVFCVTLTLIFLVVDTVWRILSFWGQGFIRRGSRVKAGRTSFGRRCPRRRPITTRTSAKPVTPVASFPPPHKLTFLDNINKPLAKSWKRWLPWVPLFFPGNTPLRSAAAYRNYSSIPTRSSFPAVGKKQIPVALVVRKKQAPVIQVVRTMQVQEPPPSWGLLSRSTQCICRSLETKQLTTAMFLGTVKHPNALRPSLWPWDTQSKKREEKNIKNQISTVPDIQFVKMTNVSAQMGEALAVPSEGSSAQRPTSKPTSPSSVSSPVPLPEGDRQRSPPLRLILPVRQDKPTGKITEVQGISKPPVREESHFRPILQETLDSSSSPPPQRAIKEGRRRLCKAKDLEGSEPASATTTSSAGQSLTTNCSSDESSAIQVEQASKGSKPTSSPFKTQCSLSTAETDSASPPVEFDKAAPAPTNATVPEVVSASAPSGPVSTAPGSASGRVVPRARRRLSSSAARRTLTSKGTISTPNSNKCRTVAPAPANATAGALELRESADSEVVPTSAPSGPVSTAPISASGRVVLQARRCLTANAAQRTLTSKGTISTPNSDKFQTVAPAPANATGAHIPARPSDTAGSEASEPFHQRPPTSSVKFDSVAPSNVTSTPVAAPGSAPSYVA